MTCPSNAAEIRLGSRHGFLLALTVALGAVVGDIIWLLAVVFGLLPLFQERAWLDTVLWLFGGVVLIYVAWGNILEARAEQAVTTTSGTGSMEAPEAEERGIGLRAFWTGFAITTFTPFSGIWWLGLLSLVNGNGPQLTAFAAAIIVGTLAWFAAVAAFLHVARQWLTGKPRRWLVGVSGLVIGAFGLSLLWEAGTRLVS